jgi:hypothetical protein
MITATVRYLADVNSLHLDPAATSGRVHQGIRETGEDPASSGQQGSVELVPDRGGAAAAGAEHSKTSREEAETQRRRGRPNAKEPHHKNNAKQAARRRPANAGVCALFNVEQYAIIRGDREH